MKDKKKTASKSAREILSLLSLKGSMEWGEWLSDLASEMRTTKTGIIDRALAELAERNGFRKPPPR